MVFYHSITFVWKWENLSNSFTDHMMFQLIRIYTCYIKCISQYLSSLLRTKDTKIHESFENWLIAFLILFRVSSLCPPPLPSSSRYTRAISSRFLVSARSRFYRKNRLGRRPLVRCTATLHLPISKSASCPRRCIVHRPPGALVDKPGRHRPTAIFTDTGNEQR